MKKVLVVLLAVAMIFTLVACTAPTQPPSTSDEAAVTGSEAPANSESQETKPATDEKKPMMGYCTWGSDSAIGAGVEHFNKLEAEKRGWDIVIQSGSPDDPASQVDIIENFITMGVDVLYVNPISVDAVDNAMAKAREAHIPVMIGNVSKDDTSNADAYILANPIAMGAKIAEVAYDYAKKVIPEGTDMKVGLIMTNAIDNNIVAEAPAEDTAAAENMMQAHPEINIWLAWNDGAGTGVQEFLNASGADQSQIVLGGMDGDLTALKAILDPAKAYRVSMAVRYDKIAQDNFDLAQMLYDGKMAEAATFAESISLWNLVDETTAAGALEVATWNE